MSENTGPNRESLRRLAGELPGIVAHKQKQIHRELTTKYRKICKVCMEGFDKAQTEIDAPMEPGICKNCTKMLKDHIAVVWNLKYAFLKPMDGKNQDLVGQIVNVTEPVMKEIEKQHETFTRNAQNNQTN